jgi:DNA-binding MarR family transcriptional regulator
MLAGKPPAPRLRRMEKPKQKREAEGLAALTAMRKKFHMDRDDKGFTVHEYAEQFGVTLPTAKYELDKLVQAGELIKGFGRRLRSDNTLRQMAVYRAAK